MEMLTFQVVVNAGLLLSVLLALFLSWCLLRLFVLGIYRCGNARAAYSSSEILKREAALPRRNR